MRIMEYVLRRLECEPVGSGAPFWDRPADGSEDAGGFPGTGGAGRRRGRALGPSAHVKPDRERIFDGPSSNRADQGSPVGQTPQAHGVQTRQRRPENMPAIKG